MKNEELVHEWLKIAAEDLDVARQIMRGRRKVIRAICFHAQQAAEKYLKGYLVGCGVAPAKTHDLVELVNRCEKHDPEFSFIVPLCKLLQPFSVQARYPDQLQLHLQDAKKAVRASEEIERMVLAKAPTGRK
jgi:HEPN domain-containing protein